MRAEAAGASAAAGAAAVVIQAVKASGTLVRVEPDEFLGILQRQERPLVVHAEGGFFTTVYQYLTSYRGLAFYTRSPDPMSLPPDTELVLARKIWMPGVTTPAAGGDAR